MTPMERFLAKVTVLEGDDACHLWTGSISESGYGHFNVASRVFRAHVWIDDQVNGPIPSGLERDHRCGVRCCVNPAHIERVTHSENIRRAIERDPGSWRNRLVRANAGRDMAGASNPNARLTETQVQEIRASVLGTNILATHFGVHRSTISRIRSGQRWRQQ